MPGVANQPAAPTIDVASEPRPMALSEVPRFVRELGRPAPTVRTVKRWTTEGISGFLLEVAIRGGQKQTSAPAVTRFLLATGRLRPPAG